ncbi:hypothetical protein KIH41_06015 [Litoribacter ruber]|uniref:Uncharacterized protein n=1 Tax=Litoribacter ruber TaxID=702568 RepID=A0AAP2CEJ3_9BACT|nr:MULTISPECIES: hypothetical protein [Litoribacter]MBS9523003.1 hypothetical protein [Litoribacter alkaliphilus]MBT0810833.1 hypothetical protein [Litoribacter ruber]
MKKAFTLLIVFGLTTGFVLVNNVYSGKKELVFSGLYEQVNVFIGNSKDYFNYVSYPQSSPTVSYNEFFIEIVHQGKMLTRPDFFRLLGFQRDEKDNPDNFAQNIQDIQILSDNDFQDLPAGEDLKRFFSIEKKVGPKYPAECIVLDVEELAELKLRDFSTFLFTLKNAPKATSTHRFKIIYQLTDGKVLETISRPITVMGQVM